MSAYLGSTKVWDTPDENGWVRPAEWMAVPEINPSDQKIIGVFAVYPSSSNFCAIKMQGAYTVNWGDGTTENFASNASAYHEYSYSAADLDSATVAKFGYKQALVTITPQSGQNLTFCDLGVKHNKAGLYNGYGTGWLDLVVNLPNCTSLVIGHYLNNKHAMLERVKFISSVPLTSTASMFQYCSALVSIVNLNAVLNANLTSLATMFRGTAIKKMSLPSFNASGVTSISNMFYECRNLTSVSMPAFNPTALADIGYAFGGCQALKTVYMPLCATTPSATTTNVVVSSASVSSFVFPIAASFSVANLPLSGAALDEMYNALPTVTGKTVTVTGNFGTATHTPSIATAKGWTVTV